MVKRAHALEEEGQLHAALDLWRKIVQVAPTAIMFCSLGSAARDLGELEEAEQNLRQAIQLDPTFWLPHLMLATVLVHGARWDEAEASARLSNRLHESAAACCLLGVALDCLDRKQEARQSYLRGLEIDPEYEEIYANMGELVRDSNPVEAEELFSKAIDLDPHYARVHREMGALLLSIDFSPEIEYHLRRAIEIDPADMWAHVYLANYLWRVKEIPAAIIECEWAHYAQPESPLPLWYLGNLYQARQEWARAESFYQRALAIAPDDFNTNKSMGRMFLNMGRIEQARVYLERTLLLNPDDRRAQELLERATPEYDGLPKRLVRRLQRHQNRWERRRDPGKP
jgi:tetratricopeptide (TPR) repeat protein